MPSEEREDVVLRDVGALLAGMLGGARVAIALEAMPRHASSRRYYRAHLGPGRGALPGTVVAMRLGPDPFRSDELTSDWPAARELPFLAVHRVLEQRGVRVPRVYGHDLPRRLVLVEDLGDRTLRDRLGALDPAARLATYERVVDLLADLQRRTARPEPDAPPWRRRFDRDLLRRELDHFRAWGLEAAWGSGAPDPRLDAALDRLADAVAALPTAFVHRDFNSRNLMPAADGSLVLIDFQDALQGPVSYDLASILCDSYATLEGAAVDRLVDRFAERAGVRDASAFRAGFWATVAQRKLKDAGRFVFLDRVRGNPAFLRSYPRSLAHVARALRRSREHGDLGEALAARIPGFPESAATPRAETGGARAEIGRDPE